MASPNNSGWALPGADTYFDVLLKPEGFEIDHLNFALKFARNNRTAIDGGAHIGTWSVTLAQYFKQVLAFEPARDTYECLLDNVSRRRMLPNVCPYNVALGEKTERGRIEDDPLRRGNTGARFMVVDTAGDVEVLRIDDLELDDLDFLKLDLEGGELAALKGARETIARCRPTIVVELKAFAPPRHGGPAAVEEFLQSVGYRRVGGIRNDIVFLPTK